MCALLVAGVQGEGGGPGGGRLSSSSSSSSSTLSEGDNGGELIAALETAVAPSTDMDR